MARLHRPELVAQWWGRGNKLVIERMEVERGGHWRFVEHSPDGVHGFEGRYREVTPPERIVQTFEWDGMPGYVVVETATSRTSATAARRVVNTSLFHTTEERDGMLSSGMEGGLNESYAALDRLLATPEGPLSGAAPADRAAGSGRRGGDPHGVRVLVRGGQQQGPRAPP